MERVAFISPRTSRCSTTSRFPFPSTPTGWFVVALSSELPPGGVSPLRYFGRELVLFRA